MNQNNVTTLRKARSMCLLYGIVCLMTGVFSFAVLGERGLGAILMTIAVLGFWRISHKVKSVLSSEGIK